MQSASKQNAPDKKKTRHGANLEIAHKQVNKKGTGDKYFEPNWWRNNARKEGLGDEYRSKDAAGKEGLGDEYWFKDAARKEGLGDEYWFKDAARNRKIHDQGLGDGYWLNDETRKEGLGDEYCTGLKTQ